jgi:hypothetical protein
MHVHVRRSTAVTSTEEVLIEVRMRRASAVVNRRTISVQGRDDGVDAVGSDAIDVPIDTTRNIGSELIAP